MTIADRAEGEGEPTRLDSGIQALPPPLAPNPPPESRGPDSRSRPEGRAREEAYRKASLGVLVALTTAALGLYGHWLYSAHSFSEAGRQASTWLRGLSVADLMGVGVVFGPFIVLLGIVIALLVKNGLPDVWQSVRQSTVVGLLLGACLVAAGLLSTGQLSRLTQMPWHYFVPVVPPVLLAYQALVVWRQRPRNFGRFSLGVSGLSAAALKNDGAYERFYATYEQLLRVFGGTRATAPTRAASQAPSRSLVPVRKNSTSPSLVAGGAYDPAYFVTHFAVPVLLLLMVGFGAMSLALDPLKGPFSSQLIQRGLRWGVAGAFVYVLIDFGSRFFRNDLTVGAATWAIITLIVGPTLAVLFSVGWKMQLSPADAPWQTGVVLFFAGLAPRRVVSIVEAAALKLLKVQDSMGPPKLIPLSSLRGITTEIAARLREENIEDASTLAYADPIRLVQNLPYDLRQVVDWMDQALLAVALPKQYEAISDRGVSGAIDLAWRWLNASVTPENGGTLAPSSTPPECFKLLANEADPEARLIYAAAGQLFYEEQVCLLWVMYNSFSTAAGMVDSEAAREA